MDNKKFKLANRIHKITFSQIKEIYMQVYKSQITSKCSKNKASSNN